MNLFNEPSLASLRQLVDTAKKSLHMHNLVIDFDGEVIIDPETKYTSVSLNRFKFHTQISHSVKYSARSMNVLFETLLSAYNNTGMQVEMHRKLKCVA
jgi:hypothetical protein